ncbi:MAG: phosphatidylglycerol lysyltransferase domain-containing protein [Candidatus Omnitrophota bacterium]
MKLNKLTLKDQKLFNRYLAQGRHELAAFSFPDIYIWKALFDIQWVLIQNSLCVFFRDKIGCFMYLPVLGKEPNPLIIKQAFEIMDGINKNKDISRIENVRQQDLGYYRALGYLAQDKYPDYLCVCRDLALLRGNKFKSQRASYNYFIKHYDFDSRALLPADAADCLGLFSSWAQARKGQGGDDIYCGMLEDNRKVIKVALANYRQLGFEGIVVKVNKQIKGFTFGYRLSYDTFCVLYEITDLSVKGLAQFIFRRFCEGLKSYKYINIMDDSGLENLRKTKLSYHPERLIPAYIVTRNA